MKCAPNAHMEPYMRTELSEAGRGAHEDFRMTSGGTRMHRHEEPLDTGGAAWR